MNNNENQDYFSQDPHGNMVYQPSWVPDTLLPIQPSLIVNLLANHLKTIVLPNPLIEVDIEKCLTIGYGSRDRGICRVGLSGVLMIGTLHAPTKITRVNKVLLPYADDETLPYMYKGRINAVLQSLNYLRFGDIAHLLSTTTYSVVDAATDDVNRDYHEAYALKWGTRSLQDNDHRYWRGIVTKSRIPGLVNRLHWIARYLNDNFHCS